MDRINEKLEQYEDAALSLVMDEYAQQDGIRLLEAYDAACSAGEQPAFPEELNRKLSNSVSGWRRTQKMQEWLRRLSRNASKAAVLFLILVPLLVASIMVAEANSQVYVERSLKHGCSLSEMEDRYIIHLRVFPYWQEHEPARLSRIMEKLTEKGYYRVTEYGVQTQWMMGGIYSLYQNEQGQIVKLTTAAPISGKLIIRKDGCVAEERSYLGYDMVMVRHGEAMTLYWLDVEEGMYYELYADGLTENRFWDVVYELADN